MKLYYSPGACSLHPQIVLRETGLPVELVRVDLRAHKTSGRRRLLRHQPEGVRARPCSSTTGPSSPRGRSSTQYIADQRPEARLIPPAGTLDRYRVQEWLNFIATEIHKTFGPLFGGSDEAKEQARSKAGQALRLRRARRSRTTRTWWATPSASADAYLFNMLTWTTFTGIDLARWPALQAFFARVQQRPAVQAALAAQQA